MFVCSHLGPWVTVVQRLRVTDRVHLPTVRHDRDSVT
jgi:hypothetical protein